MEILKTWHHKDAAVDPTEVKHGLLLGNYTMISTHWTWIALFFIPAMTPGVFGGAVDTKQALSNVSNDSHKHSLREDTLRRWSWGVTEADRERCAQFAAPWLENTRPSVDVATLLQLRVRPFSPGVSRGSIFPEKALFSFVRQVYRCCRDGFHCRSVKGIQGRLRQGTAVEFLLTKEILSLMVVRAELHIHLSNPQHLDIHPVLPTMLKHNLPTRYNSRLRGDMVELRVDLLFLFQSLQLAAGGNRGGHSMVNMWDMDSPEWNLPQEKQMADDIWGELGLALGCSQREERGVCVTSSVHLLHTPFIALYYR